MPPFIKELCGMNAEKRDAAILTWNHRWTRACEITVIMFLFHLESCIISNEKRACDQQHDSQCTWMVHCFNLQDRQNLWLLLKWLKWQNAWTEVWCRRLPKYYVTFQETKCTSAGPDFSFSRQRKKMFYILHRDSRPKRTSGCFAW